MKVTIKRTSDSSSTEIEVTTEMKTVAGLLDKVRSKIGIEDNKFMRLIHKGKLLEPADAHLSAFNLHEGSFVHLVVTDSKPRASTTTQSDGNEDATDNTSNNASSPTEQSRGGMNDLMSTHELDENDVAALRSSFSHEIEEFRVSQHIERDPRRETESEFRCRLESMWMNSLDRRRSEFWRNLPTASRYSQSALTERLQRFEQLMQDIEGEEAFDDINGEFSAHSFFGSIFGRRPYSPVREGDDNGEETGTEMVTPGYRNEGDDIEANDGSLSAPRPAEEMEREVPPQYQLGTYKDCCWGMVMGTAFGTLMLLCMFDSNRGHRYKVGVLLGICLQLFMSIADKTNPVQGDQQAG